MDLNPKDSPHSYEISNGEMVSGTEATTTLYRMNWNITSIPQKHSFVIFERVEDDLALGNKESTSTKKRSEHIFYLAHPASAKDRKETPGYYLTSVSSESLGNINLETSKSAFQKTGFRLLLSMGKAWSDKLLFDEDAKPLFEVNQNGWVVATYYGPTATVDK
ncbi:uncharacterized protein F4807DRAFT_462000 [Annulohypoxylon truncatum]|uniref:uncharacterized protein n=1 Tax=Annulohypoxylon truncatum TaxID=327061 RepID=UPI0020075FBC|nr:uncharacterized protein F4807DRAFT_462000 [Annulohypoxylon truncatum]KAI1208280.1 hypothetical protein F4807DRAFT_462000 [Annulohypoxylon truncatum]